MNDSKTDVDVCGDDVWLKALKDKPELLMSLKEALEEAVENRDINKPLLYETLTSLPRLFAVPESKKWRGVRIRSQLSKYMACFGFGHNMPKRYCKEDAPPGWPILVDWSTFKGPSENCSLALYTEIIRQISETLQHCPCRAADGT